MSGELLAVVLGAVCGTIAALPVSFLFLRSVGILIIDWPTRTKIQARRSDAQ